MNSDKLSILKKTELVTNDDFEFLQEHSEEFQKRFESRGIFRSKTEMEASVLNDATHPTADSKYWQAIGEQNVQITELINLVYEAKKIHADHNLLEAKIEELEYKLKSAQSFHAKKIEAKIEKKRIELEQSKFNIIQSEKTAKDRMREIRHWEGIIENLIPQLEFGTENFEAHHAKRYFLRYKNKVDNQHLAKSEDRLQNVNLLEGFAKSLQPQLESSAAENYKSLEEAGESDPIAKKFFDHKVKKILIGAPHRAATDTNVTNFNSVQIPAGFTADIEEPIGHKVADAQNIIIQRAIDEGFDYIFFVEDDNLIPRNALVTLMSHKVDVVGGLYYRKYLPLETAGMHYDEDGTPSSINFEIGDVIHHTLVLPSGCTLIKTEVFKNMNKPFYKEIHVNDRVQVTSDTYICEKFREQGIDIITDTNVQCLHIDKQTGKIFGHAKFVNHETLQMKNEAIEYFAV